MNANHPARAHAPMPPEWPHESPAREGNREIQGFTLLEISIVVAIIALVVTMAIPMGQSVLDGYRRVATNKKLDQIEQMLMAYRTAYNRLPCPTDPTLLPTNANYGVEAANPGSCTGGTPAAKNTNTSAQPVASNVVEGALPFKTLGLPESLSFDGWDRKFAYAVNDSVTAYNGMKNQTLSDQCGITVNDASGNNRTTGAIYALASFGSDGHGGYLKSGSRNNASVTNTDALHNCHCTSTTASTSYNYTDYGSGSAVITTTAYDSTYVQKDTTIDASDSVHPFDDIVRYKSRWQMMTPDDMYNKGGAVCTPGARIDGYTASYGPVYAGTAIAVGDINGDGIPDLLIAFSGVSTCTTAAVVFGTAAGFPNPLPLNSLNGTNGFLINTNTGYQEVGYSLAIGDINGDGYGDIVMTEGWFAQESIYVIFGHANPWSASIGAESQLNGTNGFKVVNPAWTSGQGQRTLTC
jgi:prepilin-type N-terminal cleavage/methylation domain-containing protein